MPPQDAPTVHGAAGQPQTPAAGPPGAEPTRPTTTRERVATVDVLRGVAILGILLVNIELFRGSDFYLVLAGEAPDFEGADRVAEFAVGWLAYGKFLSSFALLFGLGAAMLSQRVGRSLRRLLARRYAVLAGFGLVHMTLLFSGDILFAYALGGFVLLAFVGVRARTALWWAAGVALVYVLGAVTFSAVGAAMPEAGAQDMEAFAREAGAYAREAFTTGGLGMQIIARTAEATFVQVAHVFLLPWIVSLFLFGFAAGRAGLHRRLDEPWLRRTVLIALPLGLLLNLPSGFAGPLGAGGLTPGEGVSAAAAAGTMAAYLVGSPVLAVGYLALVARLCQRPGFLARVTPLRRTGRMALTAYLLQSVLATGFFVWLGFYDRLSPAQALGVVAAIWGIVLAVCTLWMARFDMGPVERLWRRLTYRRAASGARTTAGPTGAADTGRRDTAG